ncbi:MAG: hypothetical protein LBV10_06580 [Stenotrophomonas sp.]|jgi:hypothetical protein|uniref:hypothetical protein n=1 Tax=Stenotrophomonas sp. TaxID=69392 RepID=UPI0028483580|nr:hypothetical protein [Stenotrophomonas sp.]MDR2959196.1 hypothetical protein [Stenotrophomonas sp.]
MSISVATTSIQGVRRLEGGWLSVLALSTIFISGIYVPTPLGNLYFSYICMIATYALLVLKTRSLGLRREYLGFAAALACLSLMGALFNDAAAGSRASVFLVSLAKIMLFMFFVVFFTSIYNLLGRSVNKVFSVYLKVAYFFAALGVLQELVFVMLDVDMLAFLSPGSKRLGSHLGIAGLSVEPAFYACALLPAGAYHVSRFVQRFRISFKGAITVLAIVLSTSALGYIGLFVSAAATFIVGFHIRRFWILFLSVPLVLVLAIKVSSLDFFQLRWNDTVSVLQGGELTMEDGMNLSTYSNAVNSLISLRSFADNYGIGVGMGMYSAVFDEYISGYELPAYRDDIPGRGSATSLFARVTAELGLAGWLLLLTVLYWAWKNMRAADDKAMAIAYIATLSIILLRMGEYYANGVVLVLVMIYLSRAADRRVPRLQGKGTELSR